jgi:hypothetical protein
MKKQTLQKFIEKYYLAGAVETVLWKSDSTLECDFVNETQDLVGKACMLQNKLPAGKIGVYKTSQFTKILTALNDDIDIKFEGDPNQLYAISVNDTKTKAKFMLADPSVIKKAPEIKATPEWDIEININDSFISDFNKVRNALPEASIFAILSNGNKVNFVINYSTINSTRLSFECDATKISDMPATAFNADLFKEVLNANKGMTGTLKVSSKGLMKLEFSDTEFATSYFLVKQQIN